MKLLYIGVTKEGKKIQGVLDAKDKLQAAAYLRSQQLVPIKIKASNEIHFFSKIKIASNFNFSDIVFFTRQLSSILSSGLTLIEALRILKEQTPNRKMVDVIEGIVVEIEDGKSFSSAMTKYPNAFSPFYVSIMRAAETSGLLDKVLSRLADNLEKQQKLRSSIRSALLYPLIIIVMMVAVVFVMMIFVIPQLTLLYKNLNIELPFVTKIVVGMSNFFLGGWPFMIGISVLLVVVYRRWSKTETGRIIIDGLQLKIPVFGQIIQKSILTEFSRTLGIMVGSGTSVVDSLGQTADTAPNVLYKNAIKNIAKQVEKGVPVGEALGTSSLFPPILVQMTKIGEQTGKLDESLVKVSEYFEREVDQVVKNLTTALEPFILIVLGVGIAFLIIAIITPIYGLISTIQ